MKSQNSTRALVEAALLTSVTVILILMTLYVPLFVIVGIFIWPLPLALIYIRDGGKYSIMSLIVAGVITAVISDPVTAFGLTFTYGISGIILGYCLNKKKSSTFTIVAMTAITFGTMILSIKLLSIIAGQDIIAQTFGIMTQSFDSISKLYSSMGVPKETIDQLRAAFDPKTLEMILPVGLLFAAFTASILTYSFAKLIFKRFGYKINPIKTFSEWYVPISVAFSVITLVFISYALSYYKVRNSQTYLANSVMLLRIVFTVSGLALIEFYLKKKNILKFIRVLIYFFIITSPLSQILFFVGLIDYAVDLRKIDPIRRRYIK